MLWQTLLLEVLEIGNNTISMGFIQPKTPEVFLTARRLGTGFCIFWMTYLSQNWQGWGAVCLTRQVWVTGSWWEGRKEAETLRK